MTHEWMIHEIDRIRTYGAMAVVTSRGRNAGTFEGQPFESDEWTTGVLRRTGDRWLCVLTQLSPVVDE